jgi:hypothetical protein
MFILSLVVLKYQLWELINFSKKKKNFQRISENFKIKLF